MEMKAEITGMQTQTKGCQQASDPGRGWETPPPGSLEGWETLQWFELGLLASRLWETNSCCFEPHSLWQFVTAALGSSRIQVSHRPGYTVPPTPFFSGWMLSATWGFLELF